MVAAAKGAALFDPGVPVAFRAQDLGPGLHHIHYLPSPVNKCCLASFTTGALHLYRLQPEVEKMEEWTPPRGALLSIDIGPRDTQHCFPIVVLIVAGLELAVYTFHLDPRKSWLRPVGSASMTRDPATLLRASCSFARQCLAALYDDGTVMLYTLPQVKDAPVYRQVVAVLGNEDDAQLLKSPDDHCCSLNYYAPDYLFLLVFSRKANAAVYYVYDLHLRTLHTTQALPSSSGWARMPVASVFRDGAMTVEVGRRSATVKRLQLTVPVVPSNLLDVLAGEVRAVDTVTRNTEVLDLTVALQELADGPDTAEHATAHTRQCATTSAAAFALLERVRALAGKKAVAELRALTVSNSICLAEDDVPGLLPALLDLPQGSSHVQWYFSTVQRVTAGTLLVGVRHVLAHVDDPASALAADAVVEAAAKHAALAEALIALELPEVVALLKFIYRRTVGLLQAQCSKGAVEDVGARLYNFLNLSIALIDAHITDLIAASPDAHSAVESLQVLCKSYAKYVRDLVEMQGYLTCVVGDPATLNRKAVSKDISAGLLRPPKPVRGMFAYRRVRPKPIEQAAAPRDRPPRARPDPASQKPHRYKKAVSSA